MPDSRPLTELETIVQRVCELDAELANKLELALASLTYDHDALLWAREQLVNLLDAGATTSVLAFVAEQAQQLTGVPSAWAVTWKGSLEKGKASFRALACSGQRQPDAIPAPAEISRTVVGQVVTSAEPVWIDDAYADPSYGNSESVQRYALRSVACIPVGRWGVLYLQDPDVPERFTPERRAKLRALCGIAAPFLQIRPAKPASAKRPLVPGIVGDCPAMVELLATIQAFAPMPWPALILGETGTGKELAARALHDLSPRQTLPFVAVNCGAIPEDLAESTLFGHEQGAFTGATQSKAGLVERVAGGTLFLDEVGELTPRLQVKLLRLLQQSSYERVGGLSERLFEGRVLAATHRPLEDPDKRGSFREDLYHRLAACVLHVPPLRERGADIPALAQHLLERALSEIPNGPALTLSEGALEALQARPWPGNIRELENVLRGAIARALADKVQHIAVRHCDGPRQPERELQPQDIQNLADATEVFQRQRVQQALAVCQDNRTEAAKRLGVSRQWLHRLIAKWNVEK